VNLQNYLPIIEILGKDISSNELWFQQDKATSHTSQMCMVLLKQIFSRWIKSQNGSVNWSARTLDL